MDVASVLTLVLLALALAAQPWSVLASVLLVTSQRGVAKVVSFVAGWFCALAVVATVTLVAHPDVPKTASSSPLLSWVEVVSGAALGGYLLVRSRRPVRPGSAQEPQWMRRLNTMSLASAFVLGAFLPNYVIVVAAVDELLKGNLTQGQLVLAALAFVVLSSVGVAAPLLVLVFRRKDAQQIYRHWHDWLIAHGQAVVLTVGAMVAALLIAKGVAGLVA